MNDHELKKLFPFGATVIPRAENDLSFSAAVGGLGDDDSVFTVWDSPFHSTELSRDLTKSNDGYTTAGPNGTYFLRPLDKKHEVKV